MNARALQFIPRDQSPKAFAQRRYNRIKRKSLKHILLDRFLNQYGYDKGTITASAIIDDLLSLIEQFYRYRNNSFHKQGQLVWPAVPMDEYPKKAKSMAQTKLKPVVLGIITDDDIEDIKHMMHHREVHMKKIEHWTHQTYN
jgi:hypothetical protein